MHFDQNAFGQRIKALRRKENLTLEQMSSALNIKCGTLSGFFLDLLYQTGATLQLRPPYPVSKEYWAYI